MCGIAGFCLNPKDHDINARALARNLLLGIEERGRDATGAAWRNRHGKLILQKKDETARVFVPELALDKRSRIAILHTRMWTQGHPSNPLNNHPLVSGDIIGVHNGTLSNDDELLRTAATKGGYKRKGEVDSEAIFAMLDLVDEKEGSKFTLQDALEAPEARMAIAWLDQQDTYDGVLHLARGDGSPLVVAQTENGSLVFASTKDAINKAAKALGLHFPYMEEIKEGTYLRVKDGMVTDTMKFIPTPSWASYTNSRGWSSTLSDTEAKVTSITSGGSTSTTGLNKNPMTRNHNTAFLDLRYLDPETEVESMTASVFQNAYKTRVQNIGDWIEGHSIADPMTGELNTEHAIFSKAAERGAFLRPGQWVTTYVGGESCTAQVYRLPKTFPEGDYILRVLVPKWDLDEKFLGVEPVLLARSIDNIDGPDLYWSIQDQNKQEEAVKELTAGA